MRLQKYMAMCGVAAHRHVFLKPHEISLYTLVKLREATKGV